LKTLNLKIFFEEPEKFELKNIKPLSGIIGLYFIFLTKTQIPYPFAASKLIYIGMSEKRTNSIGSRLMGHFDGQSGNIGLTNYRKVEELNFTYLNFEMLKTVWKYGIEDLESYFILDFVKQYGVYPICNNKTGFEVLELNLAVNLEIDWNYFKK
jgi:hypothetical protein